MDKRTSSKCADNKKNIIITIGDPGGIGPEITLKALNTEILKKANILLIGSKKIIDNAAELINFSHKIDTISDPSQIKSNCINIIECNIPSENFTIKDTSKINGIASFIFIKRAIEIMLNYNFHALITAPISKKGLKLAGINFPGHTEILAHFTQTKKYRMK